MELDLTIDDILIEDDIQDSNNENTQVEEKEQNTTEINQEETDLEILESVGSNEDNQDTQEDIQDTDDSGTSPKSNFYSSIAAALKDEDVLPELDESVINTPEDFKEAVSKAIANRVGERVERVNKALEYNVEVTEIKAYEDTLANLEGITEDLIKDESDNGENLRKQLIYQDFINKGFKEDRALKATEKSFAAGTDLEDALDALSENKEFFKNQYNQLIEEAKNREEVLVQEREKVANRIKTSILETSEFEGLQLDKALRQRVYDNIANPSFRGEDGNYYTPLQKYEMENREQFIKTIGYLFTLTDGFKDISKLATSKVKKEVKRSIKELEHTLNNTNRTNSGELNYVGGIEEDPQSYDGLSLDV